MNVSTQSARDDLAFMRGVVESQGPLPWWLGAHLFAVGALFGLNLLIGGQVAWSSSFLTWLPASVAYVPVWFLINAHSDYAAMGPSARAVGAAWFAVLTMTFAIVASLVTAKSVGHAPYTDVWPSIASALYGGAWVAAAIVRRKPWMGLVAVGCFATAFACAWFVGKPQTLMVFGAALLLFFAAPGFALMRSARRKG